MTTKQQQQVLVAKNDKKWEHLSNMLESQATATQAACLEAQANGCNPHTLQCKAITEWLFVSLHHQGN